jgi:NAD(P)-dependent dehydrogenase (short-subunit alcohol dehydrogenase family)
MKLEGKVCLITGGARGIGATTALELAQRGTDIAINDLASDEAAMTMKGKIEAFGRRCVLAIADVSKPTEVARCVDMTASTLGSLDVLVHCAGGPAPGSLLEVSPEAWHRAFDVHVHAVFYLCRAAVPLMRTKREGAIVLISSAAGLRGCPGAIAYGVVKGAIPQFTRSLARELADYNIRVNCVSPGVIRTRFQDSLTPEQAKHNIEHRIPLRREGRPQDVAEVIAMLVSNDFITGQNVVIDGGMTMRMV